MNVKQFLDKFLDRIKAVLNDGIYGGEVSGAINWNANYSSMMEVTATGNLTLDDISNVKPGTYLLKIVQGGVGSYTLVLGSNFETSGNSGVTLSTAVGAKDIITFVKFAGDSKIQVVPNLDFRNA